MLIKDYIRLGRISIKSRKKYTRNTVRGIAFGLIVLVPVIYFTMAFYIGLLGAVNATRGVACFSFATVGRESEEGAAVDESDHILLGRTEYNRIYAEIGNTVEEVIYNEYYELIVCNVNDGAYAVLDGAEENVFYAPSGGGSEKGVVYLNALVKIVESGRTGKNVIPAGLNADLESEGKRFLRAGEGFSQDARGQVLIGETLAAAMGDELPLYRATHAVHSCFVLRDGKILYQCEDLGRHNALDKAVGCALAEGVQLGQCVLYTSGRVPVDMVRKAIRAGVPALVSKTMPTVQSLELAEAYGLKLLIRKKK